MAGWEIALQHPWDPWAWACAGLIGGAVGLLWASTLETKATDKVLLGIYGSDCECVLLCGQLSHVHFVHNHLQHQGRGRHAPGMNSLTLHKVTHWTEVPTYCLGCNSTATYEAQQQPMHQCTSCMPCSIGIRYCNPPSWPGPAQRFIYPATSTSSGLKHRQGDVVAQAVMGKHATQ